MSFYRRWTITNNWIHKRQARSWAATEWWKIMAEELNNNNNPNPNGGNPDETGGEGGNPNPQDGKFYTEEEILALIKSESDRKVTQALATQQRKFEKQLSLSKLDDDAREKADRKSVV